MLKPFPKLETDEQAERFVDEADLSEYDFSSFRPMRFEIGAKSAQLNMRLPQPLLDAVKARAKQRGIPYTRLIRMLLEQEVAAAEPAKRIG